jgi:D-alanine--poly(phosphoribitol) ligase subunit 1
MYNSAICYLERTVKKVPNKIALMDSTHNYTFKDLRAYSLKTANELREKTGVNNNPIAVYMPKSADSIVCFMAILYSGNFYVPLDVKTPLERISRIIQNLDPRAIITTEQYAKNLLDLGYPQENIVFLERIAINEDIKYSVPKQALKVIDTDPVYTIYTSGSTGVPKGVVVTHRGVIDYIDWAIECFNIDKTTIIGNQSPFHFDNSTLDIYLCIATGATLNIIPEMLFSFPAKLMEYVNTKNINFIFWVPSVMINVANADILKNINVSCLKKVLFAGEIMPNKQLNYWRKYLPEAQYANLYGPTEITVDCTYFIVDREFQDSEPLPIGFPCKNSDILVLNDQNELIKPGEIGELCVRGSSLALGYWNDNEKTKQAFVQNPLNRHYPERIYRTGDLVSINKRNEIVYIGRKDSQIKHMGYRIELGEIETAVLGLKGVKNACVLYNQQAQQITLFYEAIKLEDNDIRKSLILILPKYMIPTKYLKLDMFPYNANGKIDRIKLKNDYFT